MILSAREYLYREIGMDTSDGWLVSVTVTLLLVSVHDSNDDLSLRKLMLPNNGQGGGVVVGDCGADGADDVDGAEDLGGELDLKLSPAEVAVLCWERGLLRSQHGEGGDMRWTMLGHEISEEEADAMLKRWGNSTPTWHRCAAIAPHVLYLNPGLGPRFLLLKCHPCWVSHPELTNSKPIAPDFLLLLCSSQ